MPLQTWQGRRAVDESKQSGNKRWRSAHELCKEYVSGNDRVPGALKRLRSALTREIHDQLRVSWEEAEAIVEHNLIKRQEPGGKPGPKALKVTDDAIRLLPLESKAEKERRTRTIKSLQEPPAGDRQR